MGTTKHTYSVSPEEFTAAMTHRWRSLGNQPSPRLQQLWGIMAETFHRAATEPNGKWHVLQPPTGSGKTQGLCVYSALVAQKNATAEAPLGVLVVSRTIAQADEIAETIRELSSTSEMDGRVVAKHSENKISIAEMRAADILIITHAAYTRALEGLHQEQDDRWTDYTDWNHGERRLTVIDETLAGIVEENQIRADDIRLVLSHIDPGLRARFPGQVAAVEYIYEVLDQIGSMIAQEAEHPDGRVEKLTKAKVVWRGVHDGQSVFPASLSMAPLRKAMATIRYDYKVLRKESPLDRKRIAALVDATLKDCEAIMARWAYYYRKGREDTFNSSQLLIPPGLVGPVVLDATASQNFLWKLLGGRTEIANVPDGTRNYANVTLHVARASGLGKTKMKERGKIRLPRLLADLEKMLSPDRKVLLCLHKHLAHFPLTYEHKFAALSVAHWGAIDGKNDWQDYDAAVICGLPYRDPVWATNTFFALKGLQDNHWLEKPSWGSYADVRQEMQRRQLTVAIIQAINRVRCRRVIDADGNCPPTDIFIILPKGNDGDAIHSHLEEEMPGISVVPWQFELDGPSERIRRGSSHAALLTLMANRLPGETSMSFVRSELGLTTEGTKKLKRVLRDEEHELTKSLAAQGIRYIAEGRGRSAKSYLLKM